MSGPDVDDDVLALSIVEPDSFTAARNARAKELRAAKEKERAAAVAKLTKPTWTAWALNVLAREHPDEIESWLAAGDALDDALTRALGGDRDELREAQRGERAALARVVDRAAAVLTGAGRRADDQTQQRLTGTLRAAVTDAEVRDLLTLGVLADDVEAPSFGFGSAMPDDGKVVSISSARSKRSTSTRSSGAAAGRAAGGRAAEGATDADGDAARREAEAEAAERRAQEQAEAEAEEARRVEAERLAAERSRLADELRAREAELEDRGAEAVAADEAARAAHDAVDAAQAAVDAARAALDALPPPG